MKTQRCPSCGAGYDVAALELGTQFQCRKCSQIVTIGDSHSRDGPISFGLLISGVLMIATLLLVANPKLGAKAQVWPWDLVLQRGELTPRVMVALWAFVGVWAFATAFRPRFRSRSVVTITLLSVVLLYACAGTARLTIDSLKPLDWMIAAICLAAAAELIRSGNRGGTIRLLAACGALMLLWHHTKGFPDGDAGSHIQVLFHDLNKLFRTGSPGEEGMRQAYKWGVFAAYWAFILACGLGLLIAAGVRNKVVGLSALVLFFIGMILPAAYELGRRVGEGLSETTPWAIGSRSAVVALLDHGVAVWTLGTYAVADLVRSRTGRSGR